jgi:hypothetical protein
MTDEFVSTLKPETRGGWIYYFEKRNRGPLGIVIAVWKSKPKGKKKFVGYYPTKEAFIQSLRIKTSQKRLYYYGKKNPFEEREKESIKYFCNNCHTNYCSDELMEKCHFCGSNKIVILLPDRMQR